MLSLPESVQLTILSQYQLIKWLCEYEQSDKGTQLILSDTSYHSSSSLVRISRTTPGLLVFHQFMSNHFKKVVWNEA